MVNAQKYALALKQRLEQMGNMRFQPPVSAEEIRIFESMNQLTLPVEYKSWLMVSDGGELDLPAGVQLYGVVHNPLIDTNDDDRPNDNYIVIGTLASGDPILFQKGNESISIFDHGSGVIHNDEIYSSFFSFVKENLNIHWTGA